jgi:site-specific recombinase XerD
MALSEPTFEALTVQKTPIEQEQSVATGPTIASVRDFWELHLASEGRAKRTIATYLYWLDGLDRFLAERGMPRELAHIKREHIEAYVVDLQRRGLGAASVSIAFRSLRPFFAWLTTDDADQLRTSPMARMKAPSVPVNPVPVLTDEEVGKLLAATRGTGFEARRDAALIRMLIDAGLRRGELAGMRRGDVHPKGHVAFVEATTSKSRKGRHVSFGDDTAKHLIRYLMEPRAPKSSDEPLWLGRTGAPLTGNGVLQAVYRRARMAGVKVYPHQLRHTWTSSLLASGHSEGDVQQLGGWSSRDMLSRYGQAAAGERARAAYRSPIDRLGRKR